VGYLWAVIEACEAVKIPCSPCSREEHKNYIPPWGRSPEKNEGGGVSILPNFIAVQQNEGGGGCNEKRVAR